MIGSVLGNYRIRMEIGRGGMGAVYVADHIHLSRQVALKVLLPELCNDPEAVRRLFQEARATSLISHPGILEIFDCAAPRPDLAYMVMELLSGESLARYLQRVGALPASAPTLDLAVKIADAVGAAHARGIFHRDLKPDNVLLIASGPGSPFPQQTKLLDFGIAKLTKAYGSTGKTRTGSLMGTPLYMSPEQCRGSGTVDHRTDIYSYGCMLFEVFCGRPPFVYEGAGDLLVAHISEAAPDPRGWAPGLPADLAGLVLACLAKDAAQRPQSMGEIVAALARTGARARRDPLPPIEARDFSAEVPWQGRGDSSTMTDGEAAGPVGPPSVRPPLPAREASAGGTHRLPSESARQLNAGVSDTTFGRNAGERVGTGNRGGHDDSALRPRRRPVALVVATTVVLAAAGFLFYLRAQREAPPPAAGEPETAAATSAAAQTAQPATITIDVEGAPAGVTVTVDGKPARVPVELPRGDEAHVFEFAAPGFAAQQLKLDAKRSRVVTLAMMPAAPPAAAADAPEAAADRAATAAAAVRRSEKSEKRGAAIRERKPKKGAARPETGESFHRFDDL